MSRVQTDLTNPFAMIAIAPNGEGWIVWESNGSSRVDNSLLSIHGRRYLDNATARSAVGSS